MFEKIRRKAASIKRAARATLRQSNGRSPVEIMVVLVVLSMACVPVVNVVNGSTASHRGVSQALQTLGIQGAVDQYYNENYSRYPTVASLPGTSVEWPAGRVPAVAPSTHDGATPGRAVVFTQESIAGVDFDAVNESGPMPRPLVGGYVRYPPGHYDETIALEPRERSPVFMVRKRGRDVYIRLRNTTGRLLRFKTWGLDRNGDVWVFVDQNSYEPLS